MRYYLSPEAVLRHLETPSVYQLKTDELYELDDASLEFLKKCSSEKGCESKGGAFIDYCLSEGLLTIDPPHCSRPVASPSPAPSLRYLELQITTVCNLKCRHCYISGGQNHELPPKQLRRILKEFEDMQGLRVMITGGEPLLHSRFDEINDMLPEFALRKVLFTNGTLLTDQIIRKLNVHEVQVSIDGLGASHDAVRGNGMFDRAIDAVRRSRYAGLDVSIATMVLSRNTADFAQMERMFREMGVKEWTVDVPCITGRLLQNRRLLPKPEQAGRYLSYGYGGGVHQSGMGYGCGLHLMAVAADGKAAKCSFYADEGHAVGTIGEGLRACWAKVKPVRLSSLTCDCDYLEVCRGGCRYRAELQNGVGGKDVYRCAMYGVL